VEAGEIEAWWGNRPEALDKLGPRARTFLALHSRHMRGGCPERSEETLNQAMGRWRNIEEQANMERWQNRFETSKNILSRNRIRQATCTY